MKAILILFLSALLLPISVSAEKHSKAKNTKKSEESSGDRYYVTARQGLMIRSTPGKSGVVIVKMPFGATAKVLNFSDELDEIDGVKAKWAKLKYKKYTGWSFSQYLSKTPHQ